MDRPGGRERLRDAPGARRPARRARRGDRRHPARASSRAADAADTARHVLPGDRALGLDRRRPLDYETTRHPRAGGPDGVVFDRAAYDAAVAGEARAARDRGRRPSSTPSTADGRCGQADAGRGPGGPGDASTPVSRRGGGRRRRLRPGGSARAAAPTRRPTGGTSGVDLDRWRRLAATPTDPGAAGGPPRLPALEPRSRRGPVIGEPEPARASTSTVAPSGRRPRAVREHRLGGHRPGGPAAPGASAAAAPARSAAGCSPGAPRCSARARSGRLGGGALGAAGARRRGRRRWHLRHRGPRRGGRGRRAAPAARAGRRRWPVARAGPLGRRPRRRRASAGPRRPGATACPSSASGSRGGRGGVAAGSGGRGGRRGQGRATAQDVDRLTHEDEETWFEGEDDATPPVWR